MLSGAFLVACGPTPDSSAPDIRSESQTAINSADTQILSNVAAWAAAGASDNHRPAEESEPDYYALSNYAKFPEEVRQLIRHADMENGRCRGGLGNDPETYRACNRRDTIMIELKKKGWCWGGADVGYLEHWLKCADDPYYRSGEHGPESLYSEEEIRELTQPH